jgi:hypothetical protein
MKAMDSPDRLSRHLLIGFVIALVLYVVIFTADQMVRKRKGPWQVQFTTNVQGFATIIVNEPTLKITNVQIQFIGEHATNFGTVSFASPLRPTPFGTTKFEDLTYLPGSVAFDFFGHEVELLPRVLYINKKEHPWKANVVHAVNPDEKLPPGSSYDPRAKRGRFLGSSRGKK